MPKRRASLLDLSAAEESVFEPNSDSEDASYNPQKPKRTSNTIVQRKKKKTQGESAFGLSDTDENAVRRDHPYSSHRIHAPAPIRLALLTWYQTVCDTRGMPWRKPFDPTLGPDERAQRAYEVWVSEVMLQQTQVSTVIPYYNRWMEKFPTINDLASADIDQVNALWKGLGYYSRASRLLLGAKKAVTDFGGKLPNNAQDMQSNIPGIGRYSAGAICSIAYGEEVPVLDGNVHRLLSRFLALHSPPKAKATLDILWAAAQSMVEIHSGKDSSSPKSVEPPSHHPGDINQALIELGSTVCKVREPSCISCPLNSWCVAYQDFVKTPSQVISDIEDACAICQPIVAYEGVTSYPMKADRKKVRDEVDVVNVIEWRSKPNSKDRYFLLVRRPEGGLLAGLYEFPTTVNVSKSMTRAARDKLPEGILSNLITGDLSFVPALQPRHEGDKNDLIKLIKVVPAGDVPHVFSHIKKTYSVQWVVLEGGVDPPQLLQNPVSSGQPPSSKSSKGKGKGKNANSQVDLPNGAMWVPLDNVIDANIGTGVIKVWNLAKKLWET